MNSYTWDRANRLLSMGGTSYQYDGEGRRVQQTVSSTVTKYLLDIQPGLAVVLSETTGANTMRYVHSPRGIHAHKDTGGNWEWMVQDGLGSVREVVDNSVSVLESRNYDPYGNAFGATGTSQTGYGFTGELVDGSGLLDLRARRYNVGMGVFASLDTLENWNQYAYANNNPINFVDATGLQATEPGSDAVAPIKFCRSLPGPLKGLCIARFLDTVASIAIGQWAPDFLLSQIDLSSDLAQIIAKSNPIMGHFMKLYTGSDALVPGSSIYVPNFYGLGQAQYMNLCKLLDEEPRIKDDLLENFVDCVINGDTSKCNHDGQTIAGAGGLRGLVNAISGVTHKAVAYPNRNWRFRLGFASNLNVRYALGTFSLGANTDTSDITINGSDVTYSSVIEAWDNYDWANNDNPNAQGVHPLGMLATDFFAAEQAGGVKPYTVYGSATYTVTAHTSGCASDLPIQYKATIQCNKPSAAISDNWITVPLSNSGFTPYHTRLNTDNVNFYP